MMGQEPVGAFCWHCGTVCQSYADPESSDSLTAATQKFADDVIADLNGSKDHWL